MSALGTVLIGGIAVTAEGQEFEVLMVDGENPITTPFVGRFTDGPFKGQFYTQAAYDIARNVDTVVDHGRSIDAAPSTLQ